jgi:DNA polymerase III subunit delta'
MSAPLPWQADAWAAWSARLAAGRRGQALLVSGPHGVGKTALVERLAAGLLCLAPPAPGAACGACTACRQHAAGSHPDLIVLRPDPGQDGPLAHYPVQAAQLEPGRSTRVISVEQVRALIEHLTRRARPGGTRLAVLWPADALAEAGANALLKILEEPPENAMLVLIAHRPGLLPATVRSRCQFLRVAVPPAAVADAWLAQEVGEAPRRALALALGGGAPLLAAELAREDPAALWVAVAQGVEAVLAGADPLPVAQRWQGFPAERVERTLYAWLRHQLTAGRTNLAMTHPAGTVESPPPPRRFSLTRAAVLLEELESLRRLSRVALSQPLAWEALLIRTAQAP